MKIKTYVADNVQEAFYKVKTELGKDAVILQTKQIKKGGFFGFFGKRMVEVIAANDITLKTDIPKKTFLNNSNNFASITKKQIEANNYGSIDEIKNEMEEVKSLLNKMYSEQKKDNSVLNINIPEPFIEHWERMHEMQVDNEVIHKIIENTQRNLSETEITDKTKVLNALKNEIALLIDKVEPIRLLDKKNIVAFIGPTGVGKTTTIAKLAAHFALYKEKKVAMITADTFRVGAIEQLKLYGDILEIPVYVVHSNTEIENILKNLVDYELLLIDTMGFSPNNRIQIKKVKSLLDYLKPNDIFMVISAATKNTDMIEILNNYRELNYKKIIVTKLDETKSYGTILNAINITGCKLSYLTTGQNVPDDIEVASGDKIADMILGAE
ncbi:MAG TPA: flagellar biosynthesis protein FlhF [Thermoanaerobacterales bacterium]|nr:flagellar biosynthesis protein FlhF [Thermoanaerobacterales bacterium]